MAPDKKEDTVVAYCKKIMLFELWYKYLSTLWNTCPIFRDTLVTKSNVLVSSDYLGILQSCFCHLETKDLATPYINEKYKQVIARNIRNPGNVLAYHDMALRCQRVGVHPENTKAPLPPPPFRLANQMCSYSLTRLSRQCSDRGKNDEIVGWRDIRVQNG